jgi:hypothetical protein
MQCCHVDNQSKGRNGVHSARSMTLRSLAMQSCIATSSQLVIICYPVALRASQMSGIFCRAFIATGAEIAPGHHIESLSALGKCQGCGFARR